MLKAIRLTKKKGKGWANAAIRCHMAVIINLIMHLKCHYATRSLSCYGTVEAVQQAYIWLLWHLKVPSLSVRRIVQVDFTTSVCSASRMRKLESLKSTPFVMANSMAPNNLQIKPIAFKTNMFCGSAGLLTGILGRVPCCSRTAKSDTEQPASTYGTDVPFNWSAMKCIPR